MDAGQWYLLAAVLSFAMMGVFHKLADRYNATPLNITMMTMLAALLISLGRVGVNSPDAGWLTPRAVIGLALIYGVFASAGFWFFQTGLRYGRIATSWLVINLSGAVPTVLALVIYKEQMNLQKGVGFAMAVGALLLMWWDRYQDEGKRANLGEEGR